MVSQHSVPLPSLKGGGTEVVAALQKQGRGGEAGVSAWCMGLHLLIQKCPCLRAAGEQSSQWHCWCFPLARSGPPSQKADRK